MLLETRPIEQLTRTAPIRIDSKLISTFEQGKEVAADLIVRTLGEGKEPG